MAKLPIVLLTRTSCHHLARGRPLSWAQLPRGLDRLCLSEWPPSPSASPPHTFGELGPVKTQGGSGAAFSGMNGESWASPRTETCGTRDSPLDKRHPRPKIVPLPDEQMAGVYLTLGTRKGWCCHPHPRLAPSGPDSHQGERGHPWDLNEAGTNKDVHTASDSGEGDLCRVISVVSSCPWVPPLAHPRSPRQVYLWSSPLCAEMERAQGRC